MPSETGVEPTGETSWILVEAKGNLKELRTSCGAGPKSLERIRRALAETADAMGIAVAGDWLTGYYQQANRLAVLHFLTLHRVSAHLVNIYIHGTTKSDDRSPLDPLAWQSDLRKMKTHLGLTGGSPLEARVHDVFIALEGP